MTASPTSLPRIVGLDVARALALFGMFAAHVGHAGVYGPGGWRWLLAAHGRASALFAILAGVSIALMLARSTAHDPVRHTRVRIAVRGALLILVGWFLSALAAPIDVILDNLGVMFLMALVAMRWRARTLLGAGFAVLLVGKLMLEPLVTDMPAWLYSAPLVHELWGIHYPALVWIGYVLIGMGLGRVAPWRGRALGWLAASGVALAALAYGTAAALLTADGGEVLWANTWPRVGGLVTIADHSYTAFEMLGNVGVACAVIGACCWLARALPRATWPFAAAGAMTLTLYSAHVVLIAIVGPEMVYEPSNTAWIALCLASLVIASLWRWQLGQGPLERLLTTASNAAADADAARVIPAP